MDRTIRYWNLCQGNKLSMGRGNILLIQHENTNGEWTAAPKQQRQMAWPSASSWTVHLTTPVDSGENVCQ